tara:strand:+ start:97795 stop:97953 length:159 start_codon:yes stop_codon:yes gene_type:complete
MKKLFFLVAIIVTNSFFMSCTPESIEEELNLEVKASDCCEEVGTIPDDPEED